MKQFISVQVLLVLIFISSCTYNQKIRDGKLAYERYQFDLAVDLLENEYESEKSRVRKGQIAYLIGKSHQQLKAPDAAIKWFGIAYDYQFGPDALKEKAITLKQAERYDEAIQSYKELGFEIGSPYEYRRDIASCEIAKAWKKEQKDYFVTEAEFNSGKADYGTTFLNKDQILFTSDRFPVQTSSKKEDDLAVYAWTGNAYSSIFQYNTITGSTQAVELPAEVENYNDATPTLSPDGQTMIFSRCPVIRGQEKNYCTLMVSEKEGDKWGKPSPLPFLAEIDEEANFMHPALSSTGDTLFFSSDMVNSWGKFDIYYSVKKDGQFQYPKTLGRNINSSQNDQFPYIIHDTLYFASEGHTGLGGLDIFRVHRLNNGAWTQAYNLKPPINSGYDDFAYATDPYFEGNDRVLAKGYFSSSRNAAEDDVFQFEKRVPVVIDTPEIVVEVEYKIILDVYLLEKVYQEAFNPNSKVLGRKPLSGVIEGQDEVYEIGADGLLSLELEPDTDYEFIGSVDGYLSNSAQFSTKGIGQDPNNPIQKYEIEIVLDKIYTDMEITLDNIYYDFDRWEIRKDAEPTLFALANNLRLNPAIRIELASHTDCRGDEDYNANLSYKRALSAVEFLIESGIDENRIEARGYGKSRPYIDCVCSKCTEEQHQANRRTTFRILE